MRFVHCLETKRPQVQALLFDEGNADQIVAWERFGDSSRTIQASIAGNTSTVTASPKIAPGDRIEIISDAHAR
jgi:hypothetical protein